MVIDSEHNKYLPSVISQGTPPKNTLQEYVGFLCTLGGNCPLHVHVASHIAIRNKIILTIVSTIQFVSQAYRFLCKMK